MAEWRDTTWGDVITLQRGYDITKKEQALDGHVPVVSSGGISSHHDRSIDNGPGVIIGRKGTLGRVHFVDGPFWPHDTTLWVCDFKGNDPRFVFYALKSIDPAFLNVGSASPTLNRNHVHPLPVVWPTRTSDQKAIAEVLGALDDKIAANDKLGDTLGRFEEGTFTRLAAKSRCRSPLSKIARVTKGVSYRSDDLAPSNHALITLKSISREGRFAYRGFKQYVGKPRPDQIVSPGDITVAQTDLTQGAEVIGWAVRVPRVREYQQLAASLDLAIVRSTSGVPNGYLLGALRQRDFRSHCHARMSGTTVLHLAAGAIESYEVPLLDDAEMRSYANDAASRLAMTDDIAEQSRTLAAIRDELLPLLMSGKVRVRDVEKVVEGVV